MRDLLVDVVANNITPTIEQKFLASVRAFYEGDSRNFSLVMEFREILSFWIAEKGKTWTTAMLYV